MKALRLDSAAREELLHEVRYYETTRPETGRKFREAVDVVFGRIKRTPNSGKPDDDSCRRFRVKGFPFSIVYREEKTEIVVLAVRADAREPGYWRSRGK